MGIHLLRATIQIAKHKEFKKIFFGDWFALRRTGRAAFLCQPCAEVLFEVTGESKGQSGVSENEGVGHAPTNSNEFRGRPFFHIENCIVSKQFHMEYCFRNRFIR